jgi:hypothetical protein
MCEKDARAEVKASPDPLMAALRLGLISFERYRELRREQYNRRYPEADR